MAYIKPGTEIKGYIWTGNRWVKKPERQFEKDKIRQEVRAGERGSKTWQKKQAKVTFPGGSYRPATSSSPRKKEPTPSISTTRGYVPMRAKSSMVAKTSEDSSGKKDSSSKLDSSKPSSIKTSKLSNAKGLTVGGGRAKTPLSKSKPVSQSRTMWVKKGDVVGGKTVQKGYLAQYGKAEKKVTARVKLVAGDKAGQKVTYRKGRKAK